MKLHYTYRIEFTDGREPIWCRSLCAVDRVLGGMHGPFRAARDMHDLNKRWLWRGMKHSRALRHFGFIHIQKSL